MNLFETIREMGHQQVVFCHDDAVGLKAIIAIHDTTLGPALGGVRFWPYASESEAFTDVLRLSRGMTYKAAISGLNLGGGKSVIIGDPLRMKSEALLRRFGQFVESLGGRYITAEDMGVSVRDMEYIRMETAYVTGLPEEMGGSGDPSPVTAYGVYLGMKAAWKKLTGTESLKNVKVLVQGLGKVGMALVELLHKEGAFIYATDLSAAQLEKAQAEFGIHPVSPDAWYTQPVDILAPCARGGILNADTIPHLQCAVIAGSANNQLADEKLDSYRLANRGILYAPDFLINAGGLINVYTELEGYSRSRALARTEYIYEATLRVLSAAEQRGITPHEAAMQLAEERIRSISTLRTRTSQPNLSLSIA
ncbi:MAG: leucine dehydrogenase [Bacteroidia bacterium]|nr:leucine dehydrogenase [Bacteroidia bacterium]MCX7764920.1 leucine dehydrogenase [Bacteroidia bacterium]MDW8058261.1 Glu/Leu/Phe/Val dehydrogenase dimerization domain-containing protein [Bacteroidia bacterium]